MTDCGARRSQVQPGRPAADDARQEGVAGDNTARDLFNQPNHVAVAPNGDIYVSDGYVNARVVQFSGDGKFVRIIGGVKGSQPGQLQLPHGVALDSKGRILINDSDNKRVSVFDKDGTFVEAWPFPSRGGIAVAADDTVYISDVNDGIVNIVKNGKLIDSVSADRAHGMGIDTDGSIYVSGASRMTVMKMTKTRHVARTDFSARRMAALIARASSTSPPNDTSDIEHPTRRWETVSAPTHRGTLAAAGVDAVSGDSAPRPRRVGSARHVSPDRATM